ncbi:sensor histidine kinase [Zestomonas carbonaria]|nr:HAMP domain-containing sensor histidine kinase [Pseudomonas carbonaria]
MRDMFLQGRYTTATADKQFNLLQWFSVVSLLIIGSVALGLGIISTRFVVKESIERDAMLSAQFIHAIAAAEVRHVELPALQSMGDVLDARLDSQYPPDVAILRDRARVEFLDHIAHLPDALLANIYALDHTIIWSTNPDLIGRHIAGNEHLAEAFHSKSQVISSYHRIDDERLEQKFLRAPEHLFIENYIPLLDAAGKAVSVVEIYKEPKDLIARIQRGYVLIWLATAIGGGLIYVGLFWIVRRASGQIASQQKQLIANETFVALGEMSSAVAHSLRNPLAAIRSSAELALELSEPPTRGNINDIIGQVDRMSKWVRDLLTSLRPINGDSEAVNPVAVINETLHAFDQQCRNANIQVDFTPSPVPPLFCHRMLLSQIFNSLCSNAIEAMPQGGSLSIRIEPDESARWMHITVSDTGKGMSRQQETMAFKPFYTTKQGGLGVGLVMVKRIMDRFGGRISLRSREQEGTQVCLSFRMATGGEHGTQHTDC